MQDAEEQKICQLMLSYTNRVTVRVVKNLPQIVELLRGTIAYIESKDSDKLS
jgi:hypothetical protein